MRKYRYFTFLQSKRNSPLRGLFLDIAKETKSALNKFTIQYTIAGRDNFDVDSFTDRSRPLVIKLLENNHEIKFKMVLHCRMEKTNIKTGEVESHLKEFHSEIEINLESTNTDEIYSEMMKTILKRLATFQRSDSNWIFSSVVRLDICTRLNTNL